jgi:carbonic anhydrase
MTAIDQLVERAARLGSFRMPAPPRLRLAIVTCMDARIDPMQIFGLERGDVHVLRNAGGVVTDDVIRSLILSQRFLGTQEVMLIHHTGCGAHKLPEEKLKADLHRETGMPLPFPLEGFDDLDGSVRKSIERVRTNPFLQHRDAVQGFVLNVDTGSLREIR